MKLILGLLLLVSCNSQEPTSEIIKGQSNLFKYHDEANNVTCYKVGGTHGISCVKN